MPTSDFRDLFTEDMASVRGRVEAAADPTIDKRAGEIFYDLTTPVISELVRLYSNLNVAVAASFLPWTYGTYLDAKGEYEIGLVRKSSANATGTVTFSGTLGTVITAGLILSTAGALPTDTLYTFQTTVTDKIGMTAPAVAPTAAAGAAGAITGTKTYKVTFVGRGGETTASAASGAVVVTAKRIELTGIPVGPSGTTARKIYRQDTSGTFKLLATLTDNVTTVYSDNDNTTLASAVEPGANSTNSVDIAVQSTAAGADYNVAVGAISIMTDPVTGVTSVTNAAAMTGGADRETDDEYVARLVLAVKSPTGQGNKTDYVNWATSVDGVAFASVIPLWAGNNTVKVVLVGPSNQPVSGSKVTQVQQLIDPNVNGDGSGLGPIGAVVTVATIAQLNITVSATISHSTGYTLDGTSGTAATRQAITDAITAYLQGLTPGATVVWAEVLAVMVQVTGVADVTALSLNGGGASVNVTVTTSQVPNLTTVTLV